MNAGEIGHSTRLGSGSVQPGDVRPYSSRDRRFKGHLAEREYARAAQGPGRRSRLSVRVQAPLGGTRPATTGG